MRLLLLFQQLFLLAIARQVQSHVSPRTFKFKGEKEGQIGGCNAADVKIILEEIEIAKEAAEFAAEQLTKYPFFQAFQEPKAFGKKELENAGKEVFTRIAAMLDGFHKDDRFTIECRNKRCTEEDADTVAIMSTKKDGILDPILSFCPKFFETDSSTQKKLERYKKAMGRNRNYVERWSGTINMQDLSRTRSVVIMHELTHTPYVAMPIKELLGRKDEENMQVFNILCGLGAFITKDYYYEASDCYRMARGYHNALTKILKSPEWVRGARKAAENAESWALIASGMYMSKQLRIKQIPIQGIEDWMWEDIRIGAQ
ncbi:Putative metallopeptidase, catalytic domain superfamily [Colletotrichum destructivum]|uniref:Metallopeptidase, catalytic domain superfamily n=1 Tax=Colletotrichum destructivum TaxID=34406 RepID=A0AAX4HX24_9PEZI|nr:Putative metallopeptidase, catalytic domain superfamily [Colletotrichum destructivum]